MRRAEGFTEGFTLIELMITVVIIAVIAAIALPNYTDYVTRSKFSEAHGQLADLRVKMEQYYMDNRRYSTNAGGGTCGIPGGNAPTTLGTRYFTYACAPAAPNAAGDQQYVVTASGVAAQGLAGISFTINQANARTTAVTGGSQMAGKGYGANGTCWVVKKPSLC